MTVPLRPGPAINPNAARKKIRAEANSGGNVMPLGRGGDPGESVTGEVREYMPPQNSPELEMMDDLKICTDVFWLIDEKLPRCSMLLFYGPGGCGKTYLLTSVALGFGKGKWFNDECERGAILICAFERVQDTRDRIAALRDLYGFLEFPVAVLDLAGKPLNKELADLIVFRAKELAEKTGLKVLMLAIDTLRAALGGRPEGDEAFGEMRLIGESMHASTGATIAWLHHEGKNEGQGPRSHLTLADGCMVWWRIDVRENGDRVVHVEKATRGPEYVPLLAFRLVPFEAAVDVKRKPITLCSVETTDLETALASPVRVRFGANGSKPEAKLGERQKVMLKHLRRLSDRHPEGVERGMLRSHAILELNTLRAAKGVKPLEGDSALSAFREIFKTLRDRGLVVEDADAIRLANP